MYYWIMQTYKGETRAIGPYRTEEGAERRRDRSHGGELTLFRSSSDEAKVALDEFRVDSIAGRI